ncbi:MAG: glycosyl hydrolase, partial [Meiothermus sp.]
MTLGEKISLAAGSDFWHTTPVPRLGIGRIKVTDGPNGARGAEWDGISSACFPCGTALAATWNPDLVRQVGNALADEVHSKGASVLLAPTVNIHRSPLGGRNFECYSEDPYLSSRMAVAYITGLQEKGVAATVKHFVGNDSEFERNSINSEIGERALREIYLVPFEAAVKEAKVWAIMTAYNRLNGIFAAEHPLLASLVRGEWGFDGLFMSDWFGTKSTVASANAGLDLEMPGPAVFMGEKLLAAVRSGEVSEKTVEDKARQVLRLASRTGILGQTSEPEEQSLNLPEHQKVARQAAAEAIVLLKNEGDVLPLNPQSLKKLAVIGPNAEVTTIQGGGSAGVTPHYTVNFLDGIRMALGDGAEVAYERGCTIEKVAPPLDPKLLTEPGLQLEYFNGEFAGNPVHRETLRRARKMWMNLPEGLNPASFSVRGQGRIVPRESGTHRLALSSVGRSRLYLSGELLIDNWTSWKPGSTFFGMGSDEIVGEARL